MVAAAGPGLIAPGGGTASCIQFTGQTKTVMLGVNLYISRSFKGIRRLSVTTGEWLKIGRRLE